MSENKIQNIILKGFFWGVGMTTSVLIVNHFLKKTETDDLVEID